MGAPVVLTVGSLHYDIMVEADHLPRRDETAVGTRWYPKFGGKGGNQALAAAQEGAVSRMVGAVGDDAFGAFLRQGLVRGGVEAHVAMVAGIGSGISVAVQDRAGDYAATIVSGANLAIDPGALDAAVWEGVAVLVLQNEVPEAVNLAAATQARARGVRVVLNAAPYRAGSALRGLVDVLVVNAVEAEAMGGGAVVCLDSAAEAARVLAQSAGAVIVTAGAAGLAAWQGAAGFVVAAQTVQVVSSHGAGDVFVGTLAARLAAGAELEAGCHAASQAAARHVAGGKVRRR